MHAVGADTAPSGLVPHRLTQAERDDILEAVGRLDRLRGVACDVRPADIRADR